MSKNTVMAIVEMHQDHNPGKPSPQAIQSVNVHFLALYLILEKQYSYGAATRALGDIIKKKKNHFAWISPPEGLGAVTVVDVAEASDANEHEQKVIAWAKSQ